SSFDPGTMVARDMPEEREPRMASAQPIPGKTMLAAVATALTLATIGLVLIVTNLAAMPDGLDSFLSLRVPPRNVLLLGMFATIWAVIFHGCGLYNGARIRRAADERVRVIGACSLGSMVG